MLNHFRLPYRIGKMSLEVYNEILGLEWKPRIKLNYHDGGASIVEIPTLWHEQAIREIDRQMTRADETDQLRPSGSTRWFLFELVKYQNISRFN